MNPSIAKKLAREATTKAHQEEVVRETTQTRGEQIAAAIEEAARLIPGATVERRPAVEFMAIVYPVPGLAVRFTLKGVPKMRVRRGDREGDWANLPHVTVHAAVSGLRIAEECGRLVELELERVARDRRQNPDTFRTQHVGAFLSPEELEHARRVCETRGLTMSGMIRRGLALAAAEEREPFKVGERSLRGVLRLLVAADRTRYPEAFAAIAEDGSERDVVLALRTAFRGMEDGAAAARALGLVELVTP